MYISVSGKFLLFIYTNLFEENTPYFIMEIVLCLMLETFF